MYQVSLKWSDGADGKVLLALMRALYGGFETRDLKTPSAIVERQMLPKQTKRTDIGSAEVMIQCNVVGDLYEFDIEDW